MSLWNRIQLKGFEKLPSAWFLIAMNLIPVYGVFYLGWESGNVIVLYWLENIAIGLINVLKILTASQPRHVGSSSGAGESESSRFFLAPFFTIHYGIFTLVHGVFIFNLFVKNASGTSQNLFSGLLTQAQLLFWPAVGLFVSHLFSFFTNYLGKGECHQTTPAKQMFAPYGRIVALHVAILIGGFLATIAGSSVVVMLLLIGFKTILDLGFHISEHHHRKMC